MRFESSAHNAGYPSVDTSADHDKVSILRRLYQSRHQVTLDDLRPDDESGMDSDDIVDGPVEDGGRVGGGS
jgi:hypothetical protein